MVALILTDGNDTLGVACEMMGTIVTPLCPPITGTFTLDTSKPWKISN